jgi:hypothetical protein
MAKQKLEMWLGGAAFCATVLGGVTILAGHAAFAAGPLTVVELFTSQGCSDCPPADDNVRALSDRPDVLTLSFGVTYWDNLGWKDTFAQPKFTQRQVDYERSFGHDGPFTPQVVVDGKADIVGARSGEIEGLMARETLAGGPDIQLRGGEVALGAGRAPPKGADVWLVRYDPRIIEVPIQRGENGGRTLPHKNVVRELTRLGGWTGAPERFAVPAAGGGLSTAVLVQTAGVGPILAAARG